MATTTLLKLMQQTTRVSVFALRHQTTIKNCPRLFSSSGKVFAKKFTERHEWIELGKGDIGTVGISDYAQDKLGEIVFVALPDVGTEIEKEGDTGCVLESVKAAGDLYSPVAGKVTEVNKQLTKTPDLINKSPLDKGWIFKLKVKDPSDLKNLLDEAAYKKFVASQN